MAAAWAAALAVVVVAAARGEVEKAVGWAEASVLVAAMAAMVGRAACVAASWPPQHNTERGAFCSA